MKVFLSELAELKLLKLNEYLIGNWSRKVRDKFIDQLSERIRQI
jgi:plasmid stabilization system protein ParE